MAYKSIEWNYSPLKSVYDRYPIQNPGYPNILPINTIKAILPNITITAI